MGHLSVNISVEPESITKMIIFKIFFTFFSAAFAMPSPPCPDVIATDCGEGMTNCPGPVDYQGCTMPDTCVPLGEECPFYCPYNPPMDCGEMMLSCPGAVDHMGCQMAGSCVAYVDQCPHEGSYPAFKDCASQGMQNCPVPMDPWGCATPDTCVPNDQTCPSYCPYNPPMDCGEGMMSCQDGSTQWAASQETHA